MTTRIRKAATIGAVATAAALVLFAYLAMASAASTPSATTTSTTTQSTTTQTNSQGPPGSFGQCAEGGQQYSMGPGLSGGQSQGGVWQGSQSEVNLTVGQTITVTSSSGEYFVVGSPSTNGTASGTLTFTVTGKLSGGYTLSITSGSLTVAGTTYTVSSGSATMSLFGTEISGQGTTGPSGSFILQATAHGTFVGTSASLSLDFTNGTTEYQVTLSGSA